MFYLIVYSLCFKKKNLIFFYVTLSFNWLLLKCEKETLLILVIWINYQRKPFKLTFLFFLRKYILNAGLLEVAAGEEEREEVINTV